MLSKKALAGTTFPMSWERGILPIAPISHAKAILRAAEVTVCPERDHRSIVSGSEHSHCPHSHKKSTQDFTPAPTDAPGTGMDPLGTQKSSAPGNPRSAAFPHSLPCCFCCHRRARRSITPLQQLPWHQCPQHSAQDTTLTG